MHIKELNHNHSIFDSYIVLKLLNLNIIVIIILKNVEMLQADF